MKQTEEVKTNWQRVSGIIVRGHRVASAPSQDYPYGTIEKQKPYFEARGLDLSRFFLGTLNVSIAPLTFEMVRPRYTFPLLAWTDLHPPETFSFSPCRVCFDGREVAGLVKPCVPGLRWWQRGDKKNGS
jgi:hypothetical protein